MALDRSKALETAQKYAAKGAFDKAIAEYQKLVQEDPKDVRTWLKIGDLYTRKGARREATDVYARVARQYAEQGFFLKAVAVYKQILKLDPTRIDIFLRLAEMYERLELTSEAMATYEHVLAHYAREGQVERVLEMLRKMCDLEPENVATRIKLAEALSRAGKAPEAADEFRTGASLLKRLGRMEDYLKVAERLLFHRPNDVAVARELAGLYLERQDAKRALAKLQLCFKADPRDVPTLELLAEAFHQLGQSPKTVSVYREVARIHQDAGRIAERARVLRRILELEPGDQEAKDALASIPEASGGLARPAAPPEPELIEELEPEIEELEPEDEDILVVDEPEPVAAAAPSSASAPLPPAPSAPRGSAARPHPDGDEVGDPESREPVEATVTRLMTECDVFERYGLKSKVIDQLRRVLGLDPSHIEARERLKDALLADGRVEEAAVELRSLIDLFAIDKPQLADFYRAQLHKLRPSEAASSVSEAAASAPPDALLDEEVESLDDDDDVLFVEDAAAARETEAEPALEAATPSDPDEILMPEDPGLAPISPQEFEAAPLVPSSKPAPGVIPAGGSEIEEILDEVDFFIAQRLWSEARGTVQEALTSFADHPLLLDKLEEIREAEAAEIGGAPSPVGFEDQSFELAERLAEELGPTPGDADADEQIDVETVFAQFKKGIEATIGVDDTETHFDLGIAYKEMGLLDDAVHEFELCLESPQRECMAHTMIGLCHLERGEVSKAISHFKSGLYSDHKSEREELGLYFELGLAYERMKDPKEALYFFQKVQRRDPTFRGVEAKLRQYARLEPPKPVAPISKDDVDQAFDELMRED